SPETVTTSPACSAPARAAATASVSAGEAERSSIALEETELDRCLRRLRCYRRQQRRRRDDLASEQLGETREVLLEHLQHRRRVERRGVVVERVEQHAAAAEGDLLLGPVHTRDPRRLAREQLRREVTERRD